MKLAPRSLGRLFECRQIQSRLSQSMLTIALLVAGLPVEDAFSATRAALVVGNSAYLNVTKLPNPEKDSTAVAKMFKDIGFDTVVVANNVGSLDFKRAIRRFEDAAANADIAVVFFAGHGIEIAGVNYLLPVDAKLATDRDASDEAISLDRLIEAVDGAKKLRLVILDACRDNPFVAGMKRTSRTASRGISSGLGRVEPTNSDTLIAYAAKGGSTAEDGDGEHSPFTTALLGALAEPGLDIRLAFGRIRDEVIRTTSRRQEPFVYGSLGGGNISLVPSPSRDKETETSNVKADYELVAKVGTRKAWEVFLNTYNTGLYADLAREQLAKLSVGEPAAVPPRPTRPSQDEEKAWNKLKNSTNKSALEAFIRRYPNSPLALDAQQRLDDLDRVAQERAAKLRQEREAAQRAAGEKRAQEAARRAEEAARRAESDLRAKAVTEAEQRRVQEQIAREEKACNSERARFEELKSAESSATRRDDLSKLLREMSCARLRPQISALLEKITKEADRSAQAPVVPDALLITSAQRELARLGCYSGSNDGKLNAATKVAIKKYHVQRGQSGEAGEITEAFVDELGKQRLRVCPAAVVETHQRVRRPVATKLDLRAPQRAGSVRSPSMLGVGF